MMAYYTIERNTNGTGLEIVMRQDTKDKMTHGSKEGQPIKGQRIEEGKAAEGQAVPVNKMGVMPMGRLLFTMSLPAMFSMLIQALYNIVDSIFVAQVGEQALTAVSLVFPIQILMIAVGVGTGVGLNSVISRRLGEKNQKEADCAASHGIFLAFISWIVFALFGLFASHPYMAAFSKDPTVVAQGWSYCAIVTIFSLFIFVELNGEKTLQATGNMVVPMICSLVGAVTNIILDPIFIFGLFGVPRLEVAGAAIATVIGQLFAMILMLFFLFTKEHEVTIHLKGFRPNARTVRNIYAVGAPSILMQSIGSVMLFVLNWILMSFSDTAVAVLGVYYRLQSFVFMPVFGLMQGAMPIFGYNFGARNKKRLMHGFRLTLFSAIAIMVVGTLIFQFLPVPLLRMFNASSQLLSIGVPALHLISLCFVPAAVGIAASTLFQAVGHGFFSLIVSLLRQLFLIVPIAWLLSRVLGINGVWLSFPLAEVFSLVVSVLFLLHVYRKQIKTLIQPLSES